MRQRKRTRWAATAAALCIAVSGTALAPSPAAAAGAGLPYGVSQPVQHAVRMSDGTRLAVDVYYPTNLRTGAPASGRFPVLLSMTPYGKRSSVTTQATGGSTYGGDGFYPWLVRHGYVDVVADVRGTGSSDGDFQLFGPREVRTVTLGSAAVAPPDDGIHEEEGRRGELDGHVPGGHLPDPRPPAHQGTVHQAGQNGQGRAAHRSPHGIGPRERCSREAEPRKDVEHQSAGGQSDRKDHEERMRDSLDRLSLDDLRGSPESPVSGLRSIPQDTHPPAPRSPGRGTG